MGLSYCSHLRNMQILEASPIIVLPFLHLVHFLFTHFFLPHSHSSCVVRRLTLRTHWNRSRKCWSISCGRRWTGWRQRRGGSLGWFHTSMERYCVCLQFVELVLVGFYFLICDCLMQWGLNWRLGLPYGHLKPFWNLLLCSSVFEMDSETDWNQFIKTCSSAGFA